VAELIAAGDGAHELLEHRLDVRDGGHLAPSVFARGRAHIGAATDGYPWKGADFAVCEFPAPAPGSSPQE
jgi:hypothetical protein